jgi:hypothetical protein
MLELSKERMNISRHPKREWATVLPSSDMVYPEALTHRIKYYLWYLYTPYHPVIRDSVIGFGILRNRGRQSYLLGTIAPGHTIEGTVAHLVKQGYGYHRIAWEDDGEVVSLRYVENFTHQYHLRIFKDGEVRGHYEYTPECYPLLHLWDVGREERREDFLKALGSYITPHTDADRSDYRWELLPLAKRLFE